MKKHFREKLLIYWTNILTTAGKKYMIVKPVSVITSYFLVQLLTIWKISQKKCSANVRFLLKIVVLANMLNLFYLLLLLEMNLFINSFELQSNSY